MWFEILNKIFMKNETWNLNGSKNQFLNLFNIVLSETELVNILIKGCSVFTYYVFIKEGGVSKWLRSITGEYGAGVGGVSSWFCNQTFIRILPITTQLFEICDFIARILSKLRDYANFIMTTFLKWSQILLHFGRLLEIWC